MDTFLLILAAFPAVLWALGGFKAYELQAELPKVVVWYAVVGLLYVFFG